jgi:hypothetical protein
MNNRNIILTTILLALGSLALPQRTQAVETAAPDTALAGGNTADGQGALFSLTGLYNSAFGLDSLLSLTDGNFCTGVGAGALISNTASENTATGAGALLSNTTGARNAANGAFALSSSTAGNDNTAVGLNALFSNVNGDNNTAIGRGALGGSTGSNNIALGNGAGSGVTTASNAICIGAAGNDVADSCYIGNIFGATSSGGNAVFVNSNGRLGSIQSSRRFKDEIKPMDKASEALLALKPVTFRYKKEIDPQGIPQFGLVAEDVEKVNPDLVVRDKEGKPYSVRYEQVNAMLLNEFLKEHRTVQELRNEIAALTSTVKEQASQIQKVSAQVEASKSAPQVVLNKQ